MAARRKSLTDTQVENLKAKEKRYTVPDPELRGHMVRITPNGVKTFVAVARDPSTTPPKQVWTSIETSDRISIEEAREIARKRIQRIKAGLPAIEPAPVAPDSFKAVAGEWMRRHVRANKLRCADEYQRILDRYLYPAWQDREFASIRRSDIAKLMDSIEDEGRVGGRRRKDGKRQADLCLAVFSGIANFYAGRNDDYQSPVIRGMRRAKPKERAGKRILSHDELRTVWTVAEGAGLFGVFVRLALLTGQRRDKLVTMKWADVTADGTWTIPTEAREKGNPGKLTLPPVAMDVLREQTVLEGNPYVFAGAGKKHFQGWSRTKLNFDAKVTAALQETDPEAEPLSPWAIHDLRRTARSLLSGVASREVAEIVLGHVLPGIVGTYDHHDYEKEKRDALAKLASMIESIVRPQEDNVVQFQKPAD